MDIALTVAVIALAVPFVIEWLKRPRLQAKLEGHWVDKTSTPWTFAHVWIRNKPLPPGIRNVLVRESAAGCTATIQVSKGGDHILPEIPARWSSRPEPMRVETLDDHGMAILAAKAGQVMPVQTQLVYDQSMVPQTLTNDLGPGRWEEVAVAILFDDGAAFVWGAESYADGGRRADWQLGRGEYDVALRVESSGIRKTFNFKLDNLPVDFSRFGLRTRLRMTAAVS